MKVSLPANVQFNVWFDVEGIAEMFKEFKGQRLMFEWFDDDRGRFYVKVSGEVVTVARIKVETSRFGNKVRIYHRYWEGLNEIDKLVCVLEFPSKESRQLWLDAFVENYEFGEWFIETFKKFLKRVVEVIGYDCS